MVLRNLVTRICRQCRHLSDMKILATYFRAKAELCRELADTLSEQRDLVASKLRSMADEFEQNASVLEDRLANEAEARAVQNNKPDRH